MKNLLIVKTMIFPCSHVWMWELDHKKGWAVKHWYFLIVVLEKTLKSPLNSKEIKPINPKGNQFWKFIGRTDAEAEAPVLWPPDSKSWLIGKNPNAGKDLGQEVMGQWRMRWLEGITNSTDIILSKLWKIVKDRDTWCVPVFGMQTVLRDCTKVMYNNWTTAWFRKCSNFIVLHIFVQFFQHHLSKRLSFLHCIFLPPLSKIRCPCVWTNEVDEPTAYYTVKSESENQILHINPHIWNLERR